MTLLDKQQIIDVDDVVYEDIEVEEWGGSVRVRVLTGTERDKWEQECINRTGPNNKVRIGQLKVGLLAATLINEEGELLFSQKELTVLNSKSSAVIQRLFKQVQRVSAIGDEAVDELAKN